METTKDNSNAFLIHISAFAGYFFPLGGVIAPLIFWQVKKDKSAFFDEHGKEAVNFNLSFLCYFFEGFALVMYRMLLQVHFIPHQTRKPNYYVLIFTVSPE